MKWSIRRNFLPRFPSETGADALRGRVWVLSVGRAIGVVLAVVGAITVTACSGGLAAASSKPPGAYRWRATPGARVSLVPVLAAGRAGWCMQTVTRIVTGNVTSSSRACPEPPTSTGPIFAEGCEDGEEGAIVFVLTQRDVASVSIAGGRRIPTTTNATLPEGLRAASLQAPEYGPKLGFLRHCPAVTAFAASGKAITRSARHGIPLAASLPRRTRAHPERPPRGVCELTATRLRLGTVAWEGAVVTRITAVPRLLGRALLSCARTVYVHSGGHYVSAAVLLDASHPGAPPPLPGMKPLAGHPGVFAAQSSEGRMVARHIPGAWLVATEETPIGLAVPVELLEHLRATIHL
jgi:hypothetical protein